MNSAIEAMARAAEAASCPHREGPFGGYDYGYCNATPPKDGRYVIRDFRDPQSKDWGKWLHQTNDRDLHERTLKRMAEHHVLTAALTALAENITPEMVTSVRDAVPQFIMEDTAKQVIRAMCAAAVKGEGR